MRRFLLPIFAPLVLWIWAILVSNAFGLNPPRLGAGSTGPSNSSLMDYLAAFLAVPFAAMLQLTIGLPSIRLLRTSKSLFLFVLVGGASALLVSFALSAVFRRPEFGESLTAALPYFAFSLVPAFMVGYVLLYFLHWRGGQKERRAAESTKFFNS
jgi:hypothetical protein